MIKPTIIPQKYCMILFRISLIVLISLILMAAPLMNVAGTATWTVCAGGSCNYTTIQAAINNASNDDTIQIRDATHTENSININKNLILEGLGMDATIVQAAAAASFNNPYIFNVGTAKVVTFRDMTIRYGGLGIGGFNGAIDLDGPVTMERVKVTQNWVQKNGAGAQGGAIYTQNFLTITHSIISDNQVKSDTAARGAGIFVNWNGSLTLINSRIINNQAIGSAIDSGDGALSVAEGGGLFLNSNLEMKDSEVSRNQALGGTAISGKGGNAKGGGIFANSTFISPITITNSTISSNRAAGGSGPTSGDANGGGIFAYTGSLDFVTVYSNTVTGNLRKGAGINSNAPVDEGPQLKNSIFAGNRGPTNANGPDLSGNFTSQDYNLIENNNGYTFSGTTTHNQSGVVPLLAALAFNGGSTQTHALRVTSPAFDWIPSGSNGCTPGSTWDQIGTKRPMLAGCDLGAYEMPYLLFLPIVLR